METTGPRETETPLVDHENGVVTARIFVDEEVYKREAAALGFDLITTAEGPGQTYFHDAFQMCLMRWQATITAPSIHRVPSSSGRAAGLRVSHKRRGKINRKTTTGIRNTRLVIMATSRSTVGPKPISMT